MRKRSPETQTAFPAAPKSLAGGAFVRDEAAVA
jgi:hypothetical protein